MASLGYVLSVLLLSMCATTILDFVDGQTGFISLDCGKPADYSGTDGVTGLTYTSDAAYVEAGDVHTVTSTSEYSHSSNLRSFPTGNRNCYNISSIEKGRLHLVRTFFFYGNYDGKNSPPTFDLYLDVDFWDTIKIPNDESVYHHSEILVTAKSNTMFLCLFNKGKGTPFVSAIDVRPLIDTMYDQANSSWSLVTRYRLDFAGAEKFRYKEDPYDRFWQPYNKEEWSKIATNKSLAVDTNYNPAIIAMQIAATPRDGLRLDFNLTVSTGTPKPEYYVYMHFAELETLRANETRVMDIYRDNKRWYFNLTLNYLSRTTVYSPVPRSLDNLNMSIRKAPNSTLPPSFNAMEVYEVRKLTGIATNNDDAVAVMAIKEEYNVKKGWRGDPCASQNFEWEGLNCSYGSLQPPRIISLVLASGGLTGKISESFAELTELQSLDLSSNNLTGPIPESLGRLEQLSILDLSGNMLNGSIPTSLASKAANGSLTLRLDNNPLLNTTDQNVKNVEHKDSNLLIILATSIGSFVVLLVVVLVIAWRFRKWWPSLIKRNHANATQPQPRPKETITLPSFSVDRKRFTVPDLVKATSNFNKILGRGGFGTVYYGALDDGVPVAVKILSQWSPQGPKQFQVEARLLSRIHHKNLVSLVGYCNENDNLGLIYEYMAQGSLQDHLSGEASKASALHWKDRLRISVEAAQGVQYLHDGCTPRIVHRDIKTSNILLNEKFETKIGDFGLSRIFEGDHPQSNVFTNVVGTLGYLDPEYYNTSLLNEKSDVYSFGVVLLELITGLPAMVSKENRIRLVDWVKEKVETGYLTDIVDKTLKNYNPSSVWKLIDIATLCTKPSSAGRPGMMGVLVMLHEAVELDKVCFESSDGSNSKQQSNLETSNNVSTETFSMDVNLSLNPRAR